MHRMTWYIGTCKIMAMGLLYRLDFMVRCVCVCVWALDPVVFVIGATIAKWLVTIGHTRNTPNKNNLF